MNKTEMTEMLSQEVGMTKTDASEVVDALFGTDRGIITRSLRAGQRVQVTGFGTFEPRERKARMGRNPQTGEQIHIPATTVPAFKAGRGLRDAMR